MKGAFGAEAGAPDRGAATPDRGAATPDRGAATQDCGAAAQSSAAAGRCAPPPTRAGAASAVRRAAERAMTGAIRGYQLTLSPWLGRECRYWPTCSAYAIEAIERLGSVRGAMLAARRIGRCHPWGGSGYDPVPDGAARERPRRAE